MITALTINYNTPELMDRLLSSFRKHYDIPYIVIDGSDTVNYKKIIGYKKKYKVKIIHFPFNIHHGPGMAFGLEYIQTDQILLLDSDLIVIKAGFLEDLQGKLRYDAYGIGDIQIVNERGMNVPEGIKYLHPACALLNRNTVMRFPLPVLHGAPMISAMKEIHERGLSDELLIHEPWITMILGNPGKSSFFMIGKALFLKQVDIITKKPSYESVQSLREAHKTRYPQFPALRSLLPARPARLKKQSRKVAKTQRNPVNVSCSVFGALRSLPSAPYKTYPVILSI